MEKPALVARFLLDAQWEGTVIMIMVCGCGGDAIECEGVWLH